MQSCRPIQNHKHDYLLMDCGSHRSYISSHLAQKLNLKIGKKEKISILTFGSTSSTIVTTQTTSIKLNLKDGSQMALKVNVVPSIAGTPGRLERFPINLKTFEALFCC